MSGRRMDSYTDFSTLTSSQKATYLDNAKISSFGATSDGGTNSMVNVPLSAIGLPAIDSTDQGKVLTVNDSDQAVWEQPSGGITNAVSPLIIPAGYNDKIELQYDSDTLDVNASNQLTVKDPIPDTSSANDGDVLTYSSDAIVWAAPQGGGGGDSNIAFLEFTVAYNSSDEEYHLTAASMTPQEIVSAIESGKSVFARCARMKNDSIESIVQIPFSKYYNEHVYYPASGYNIWFGALGSGGSDTYFNINTTSAGSISWTSSQWDVSDIDVQ